jgi:hypothetical protein
MFVPLHDGVPLRFMRTPYITYGLIGACLALQIVLQALARTRRRSWRSWPASA